MPKPYLLSTAEPKAAPVAERVWVGFIISLAGIERFVAPLAIFRFESEAETFAGEFRLTLIEKPLSPLVRIVVMPAPLMLSAQPVDVFGALRAITLKGDI